MSHQQTVRPGLGRVSPHTRVTLGFGESVARRLIAGSVQSREIIAPRLIEGRDRAGLNSIFMPRTTKLGRLDEVEAPLHDRRLLHLAQDIAGRLGVPPHGKT